MLWGPRRLSSAEGSPARPLARPTSSPSLTSHGSRKKRLGTCWLWISRRPQASRQSGSKMREASEWSPEVMNLGLRPASKTHLCKTRPRGPQEIPKGVFKPFLTAELCSKSDMKPSGNPESTPLLHALEGSCSAAPSPQPDQGHFSPQARWTTACLQATVPTAAEGAFQVLP